MDDEYVETSEPEEVECFHVWRKRGNGERVLDTVRVPFGNKRKRVKLDIQSDSRSSSPLSANVEDLRDDDGIGLPQFDASQDPLLIQAASPPPETEALGLTDPLTPTTSLFSYRHEPLSSSQSPANSQDPLHLSPQKPRLLLSQNNPIDSPSNENENEIALPPSLVQEHTQPAPPSRQPSGEDDLMLFSPLPRTSSLSPAPSLAGRASSADDAEQSPYPTEEIELTRPPSPEPGQDAPNASFDPTADELPPVIPPDPEQPTRYGLRTRTNRQKYPYKYDTIVYQTTMQNNPDAMVDTRSLRHAERQKGTEDRYEEEEEESQDRGYQASDHGSDEDEVPGRRRRKSLPRDPTNGAIPELPDDGDIEKSIQDLRRDLKRIQRKERDARRAEEEEAGRATKKKRRTHHFPMERGSFSERDSPGVKSPIRAPTRSMSPIARRAPSHAEQSNAARSPDQGFVSLSPTAPLPADQVSPATSPHRTLHRPLRTPSPSPFRNPTPELPFPSLPASSPPISSFRNPSRHSNSPTPQLRSSVERNTYDTAIVIEDDHEDPAASPDPPTHDEVHQSDSDDSPVRGRGTQRKKSSATSKKHRKGMKLLNRLYPTFMLDHFDRQAEKARRQQQRGTSPPSESEPVPGHARKRLNLAKKAGPLKEVKGDTESSDDDAERDAGRSRPPSPMRGVSPVHTTTAGSLHDFSSPSKSPSPARRRIRLRTDHRNSVQDVIDISDDDSQHSDASSSSSSAFEVDDDVISCYIRGETPEIRLQSHIPRDEKLIDYMLASNVTIGRRSRGRRKDREEGVKETRRSVAGQASGSGATGRGSGHDHRGGGNGGTRVLSSSSRHNSHRSIGQGYKQTHLTFENHRSRPDGNDSTSRRAPVSTRSNHDRRISAARGSSPESSDYSRSRSHSRSRGDRQPAEPPQPVQLSEADKQKKAKKQKEKERREKARRNGVYVFDANGATVTSGRRQEEPTTEEAIRESRSRRAKPRRKRRRKSLRSSDLKDEELRKAILAPADERAGSTGKSSNHPRPQMTSALQNVYQAQGADDAVELSSEAHDPAVETDAEQSPKLPHTVSLPSGKMFGTSTYIGKGLLSQLKHRSTPSADFTYSRRGFTINSLTTLSELNDMIPRICTGALESIDDLPVDDDIVQFRDWDHLLHGVCWAISFHLRNEGSLTVEQEALRSSILSESQKIVSRFHDSTIDLSILSICWFALEILLRAGFDPSSASVHEAAKLVASQAFTFGILKTVKHVRNNNHLNDPSSITQRIAELWVCLIHAIPNVTFWKVMEDIFEELKGTGNGVEVSEAIWHGIFGISALSQFSALGTTLSLPHLPSAWNVVHNALKLIRLKTDESDKSRPEEIKAKRDLYIRQLVTYCFLLTSTWGWKLNGTGDIQVLDQLRHIFGSRSFANLEGEKAEYPEFLSTLDWGSCSKYNGADTAFVMFLKMVVQVLLESPNTPKARKLCSMIVPQTAVHFTHGGPPTRKELGMLYNRVASISLIIYFDPTNHAQRLSHARGYVDFSKVGLQTRKVFMQSLMRLSVPMVLSHVSMKDTFEWFGDIGAVIKEELVNTKKENPAYNNTILQVSFLVSLLKMIVLTYIEVKDYPDPGFFLHLKTLFGLVANRHSSPGVSLSIMRLIQAFFQAREAVVQPPKRPALPEPESEESQETQYEFDELDTNNPDFLKAVDAGDTSKTPPPPSQTYESYESNDARIAEGLKPLHWLFFRMFKDGIQEPTEDKFSRAEESLETWLQCVDLEIRSVDKTRGWVQTLDQAKVEISKIRDPKRRRRVEIRLMYSVLKLDPMSYQECPDRFLMLLLPALIPVTSSSELSLESNFLALLLTIDGARHPLLQNLPFGRASTAVDYEIDDAELQDARWEALRCIFSNVNRVLEREELDGITGTRTETGHHYVRWCIDLLSLLKDSLPAELNGTKRKEHEGNCLKVWDLMQEQQWLTARRQSRLSGWVGWMSDIRQGQQQ
ncbi:hypothetical protein V5O48_001410 [Marasmius crinis-equi]|uniref:Uncharacterized protein n=1 Tax=Marasmius crinis-equi TaxID=585013 RepID=A0ABR3FYH1_9AGAR